jgi:hypothetical protein
MTETKTDEEILEEIKIEQESIQVEENIENLFKDINTVEETILQEDEKVENKQRKRRKIQIISNPLYDKFSVLVTTDPK